MFLKQFAASISVFIFKTAKELIRLGVSTAEFKKNRHMWEGKK